MPIELGKTTFMSLLSCFHDEEKVLKYEREAEKQKLAENAKRKKQEELETKRREKELDWFMLTLRGASTLRQIEKQF